MIDVLQPGGLNGHDAQALESLKRHGGHSSAFLAFNQATQHYASTETDGLIAYRDAGRHHTVEICGPFAAPEDKQTLLGSFRQWSRSRQRRIVAVQLRHDEALDYARAGFVVNQLGSAYSINLDDFTLRGTRFMKVRNKLARARRLGVLVDELTLEELRTPRISDELAEIDAIWLRSKGRFAKELSFMIGERGGRGLTLRRIFVARLAGRIIAYVTYSPCFGDRPGWLYDLTRRHPSSPPGTIELIFHGVLEKLQAESHHWLHLGLTPLVGLDPKHEIPDAANGRVRWFIYQLGAHGEAIYPAHSQEAFKLKWGPQTVEPEYVAFESHPSLPAIWHLMRMTRAI
jgi:lysylphosphatidylglycerol synthetase-like protein (DUF2156 family)